MTNSEKTKIAADQKRSDAKKKLSQMFLVPDGYSSTTIDQIVDDVISAAILEVAALQSAAIESNDKDLARRALDSE